MNPNNPVPFGNTKIMIGVNMPENWEGYGSPPYAKALAAADALADAISLALRTGGNENWMSLHAALELYRAAREVKP